jgi:DNA-binding SARP family transcriptional activator/tetratricopeptide (TPR) repeat protein
MLRVRVLGELALERDDEALAPPAGRRLRGLLGWLALHPGMHARSEVAGQLWPDVLEESARTSLRTALAELRRALGDGLLVATRDAVGLAGDVWVDARAFDALVAAERLDDALALVRGPVLEDLSDDWVHAERDRRRDDLGEVLGRLAARAEAAGDLRAAVAHSRALVALDPLAEDGQRDLIRRLAASGDRAAALATYAQLRERLARELRVAPSEPTRRLVQEIRAAEPPPPLPGPLGRRHRSPFVGRAAVLQRLQRAIAEHRLVLLTGEPGIGKTRTAAELARAEHAAGRLVLYGRADEEAIAPYQPFAEALRPYLAVRSAEQLRALAGPLAGELARLVPDQADRLPELADAATRDPAGARYRLFEAAAAAIAGAAAERPLLLVLDDLQWADRPTLLLLRHLARADRGPAAILGTYRERSPALAAVLADLQRDDPPERVALAGLGERDVDALVTAWLGADAPAAVTGSVHGETGGNPFFVEELLRQLRAGGELGVPETVKDVLARRLAGLGQDTRDTLLLAAAAGREIDLGVLAAASELSREGLVEALDAALAAHLLRDDGGRYAFPHALVREALYEQVSSARRALLHGRIAAALELAGAADAELAFHYVLAGEPAEKAVEYSVRAGAGAAARLAYEEAARHYERALALPTDRRAELLIGLGEAHLRAGDVPAARERFSEAARAADDPALLARAALGRSGLSVTVLGHDPDTVALLERALGAVGDDALRARLLGRLAIELYHSPPVERREELSGEAVALARRAGDPAALIDALSARHVALWSPPHLDERLAIADEMIALATGDRERALQGHNWRVLDLLEHGDVAAAEQEIDVHAVLADELRLPGYQWWAPMWRAMLAFMRGDVDEAVRLRAEAVEIGRRASDQVAELFNWIQAVFLDLEREPVAPDTDLDVPDRVAVQAVQSAFRSDLPLLYAEMGRTADAQRELATLADGGFAGVASDMNWLASMTGLGQAAALLSDSARAAELYALMLAYRGRAVLVGRAALCLGPVEMQLGILASALGHFDAAEQHLAAASTWAAAVGARQWVVWTQVHRADLDVRRGDGAARAGAAAAAAEELGFGRAAARARAIAHAAAGAATPS